MAEVKRYIRSVKNNGDVILSNIIDSITGEAIEFIKVDDSTQIIPDGVLYRQLNTVEHGTEIFKRIFSGPINVKWFGAKGDGITDDTPFIQQAINVMSNGWGLEFEPNGIYNITSSLNINKTISIEGRWCKILNNIPDPRGTLSAIFNIAGTASNITTLINDVEAGFNTISVASVTGLKVGDVISITGDFSGRNISIIKVISENTLTLDRSLSIKSLAGSSVNKFNTITNTSVKNFNIDFNGKYGYGVHLNYGQNCIINNIKAKNIGSKVVQFTNTLDSEVANIDCEDGFDVSGTGGHSYVIRFATSNDNVARNIRGSNVRHVFDLSAANRNRCIDSEGYYNFGVDFLTHSNNCKDNEFINIKSIDNRTAACGFDPTNGDTGNILNGGYVQNSPIMYFKQNGTNIVKDVTVLAKTGVVFYINPGILELESCTFNLHTPAMAIATTDGQVTFSNSTINCHINRSVINSNVQGLSIEFNNTSINIIEPVTVIESTVTSNINITLKDCKTTVYKAMSPNSFLFGYGNITAINSIFDFKITGEYVFGQRTSKLEVDKCIFRNAKFLTRKLTNGDCSIKFGSNSITAPDITVFYSFGNFVNLSTFDFVNLNTPTAPVGGSWLAGSKVLNTLLSTDKINFGWIYNGTEWIAIKSKVDLQLNLSSTIAGRFGIDTGNNIDLTSLNIGSTARFPNANIIPSAGVHTYTTGPGSLNYPTESGIGIKFVKFEGSYVGYFELFKSSDTNDSNVWYRIGITTTTTSGWLKLNPWTGTTANRPTLPQSAAGLVTYNDTTLQKPITWWGSSWKDATGTIV